MHIVLRFILSKFKEVFSFALKYVNLERQTNMRQYTFEIGKTCRTFFFSFQTNIINAGHTLRSGKRRDTSNIAEARGIPSEEKEHLFMI